MKKSSPLDENTVWQGGLCALFKNFYASSLGELIVSQLQTKGITILKERSLETGDPTIVLIGESSSWDELRSFICGCAQRGGRVLCLTNFHRPLELSRMWEILQAGADDVLHWTRNAEGIAAIISRLARWKTIEELLNAPVVKDTLVGQSIAWRKTLQTIIEVAIFSDAPVLLEGESGTGKELLASLIHKLAPERSKYRFVTVDCTTLSADLVGSELFGHDKGAFTHAISNRDGAIALADKGVLFLDEIGELSLDLQVKLLRAIQERMYKRLGSDLWRDSDFRLVCATNRHLEEEVRNGRFREDLFYRITACTCRVPPLRQRREDIPLLAEFFARKSGVNQPDECFDRTVMSYLCSREYPGNVRELQQLVGRMVYRYAGKGPITLGTIPELDRPNEKMETQFWNDLSLDAIIRKAIAQGYGLKDIKRRVCAKAIDIAIAECNGSLQDAAYILNVSDRTIQMRQASRRGETTPYA